jgi:predicted nuclease of restriction endonuclease-like (RecB) superfamily
MKDNEYTDKDFAPESVGSDKKKRTSKGKKNTLTMLLNGEFLVKSFVLDNLGYTYFKLNNPKAIDYLNQSLKIRDSINNNSELIASYMHMAEYYQKSNLKLSNDF